MYYSIVHGTSHLCPSPQGWLGFFILMLKNGLPLCKRQYNGFGGEFMNIKKIVHGLFTEALLILHNGKTQFKSTSFPFLLSEMYFCVLYPKKLFL